MFAAAFALAALLFVAGSYLVIETKNRQGLDALIRADVEAVTDKVAASDPEIVEAKALALVLARSARADDPRRYRLERSGRVLAGRSDVGPRAVSVDLGDGAALWVGRLDDRVSVGRELIQVALFALAIATVAALVVGPWASQRLLRRVSAINEACDRVRAGDLSSRAPGDAARDEFGALARHVNAMLERIDGLVTGLRDVSNRVAHDLRTPMARLKSDLDEACRSGDPEQTRRAAAMAAVSADEILQTFEALLDIAEAEAGSDAGFQPIDLGETVQAAVDLYREVAEDRGVTMMFEREPAPILGERLLLVRLSANLIDNAIKFSPPGASVLVGTSVVEGEARLSVEDQGPGIAEAEQEQVLRRFVRGGAASAAPGHGLGLALVAAVAKRHGARLSLQNGEEGLRVSVAFPAFRPR